MTHDVQEHHGILTQQLQARRVMLVSSQMALGACVWAIGPQLQQGSFRLDTGKENSDSKC